MRLYGLRRDDLITIPGLATMGRQILAEEIGKLPTGSVVSAAVAGQIQDRVQSYNAAITSLAKENGALLLDLNSVIRSVRVSGLLVGTRTLTADFLGGFYLLNGLYPGFTGHGLMANEMLRLINQSFGTSYSLLDLNSLAKDDPARRFRPARRPIPVEP